MKFDGLGNDVKNVLYIIIEKIIWPLSWNNIKEQFLTLINESWEIFWRKMIQEEITNFFKVPEDSE